MLRTRVRLAAVGAATIALALAASLLVAPTADARTSHARRHHASQSLGTTTVTTAPGIATTFLKAGVLPLPVLPQTRFGVSFRNGLQVSYGFPITSSTADLAGPSGDILHSGGIYFRSLRSSVEIGKFDVDLAAGKIFATQVNFAAARVPVLDLDLSGLTVGTGRGGSTVLSGIGLRLDPAAAGVLNSTFGLNLPTDGSLTFGTARIVLNG